MKFKFNTVLLIIFSSLTSHAATYYVSTTGSDSNPGTSTKPWRNPARCALSPIKPGDICRVKSGTYTDTDLDGVTVWLKGSGPNGTASAPITIMSDVPLGATIQVPSSINGPNTGFRISKSYYRIEGFNITGGAKNLGANTSYAGIVFNDTFANGASARNNSIHHIGRTVCSNSSYGFSGILVFKSSNVVVENNKFYTIGRLRNGESGCKTDKFNHDHGIYIKGSTNLVVRRNVFYDTSRGYPIHVFGATASNLNIYHNTISGKSPTGRPAGHIMLASTINGANIKNNISSDVQGGIIDFYNLKATKVVVSNNMSSASDRTITAPVGVTFASNILKVLNIGFVSKSLYNFRLLSTSPARNRGTLIGPSVPDGKPDLGAFEY